MTSSRSNILYKYLGPTTVHLQNEFALLGIMFLFTIASFCTMYHSNEYLPFSQKAGLLKNHCDGCHWNEIAYIILSTAWLGRHLVQRIICTTEAKTSTSNHERIGVCPQHHPSIISNTYRILIWIFFGGQYCDIPSCPIQFASPFYGHSSSFNALNYSTTSTSSDSGLPVTSRFNSIIRTMFQSAAIKPSAVGVAGHHNHNHRSMNRSNMDNFMNQKTPPIHRTYIVQVFFIIPMIVVPISTLKFIMKSLRSRKRLSRGYYDSDDEDDITSDRRRKRRSENSHNNWDDIDHPRRNGDSVLLDKDDENVYIKIHFKTQNQVNSHIDTLWKYTPSVQFVIFFVVLSFFAFVGVQFYKNTANSLEGSGNAFKGNKRFGYENYVKYNNPGMNQGFQPYAQNLYPGGPGSQANNFGSQSTILNAELMAQRFEKKQRQMGSDIGGNPIHYTISLLCNKVCQLAAKLHMKSWKSTYYSPWGMVYIMSLWGIVASLLLFGRFLLPIPDLTARGRDSWVGKGTNKSNKQKRKEKSWAERYTPITTGNRFHLHFKVLIVRVIENVIVCAIIPQSSFMCKATGHCNIEPTIFEMGDPTLIQSRTCQSNSMFDNLIYDHLVANFITFSVINTSILMILSHILVLDRSSLSLEAHNYVQGTSNSTMRTSDTLNRRGGKKFNSISNDSHKFWNDNSNGSPNGYSVDKKRNYFAELKSAVYECFSLEIGALSTSQILCYIFYAYTLLALIAVLLAIYYFSTGTGSYPLVLVLFAIFSAAGGSDVDTADFDELDEIANEINSYHEN